MSHKAFSVTAEWDTYVPPDMKISPCSLIKHAITIQSQFIIALHVTHRKARFAIWAVTLPTQIFSACLLPTTWGTLTSSSCCSFDWQVSSYIHHLTRLYTFPSWTESSLDWVVLLAFGYQCFCQFTQKIQEWFVWMTLKLFIHNPRIYNAEHETSIKNLLPPFQRLSVQVIEASNLIGKVITTHNLPIELYCFWARYLPPSAIFVLFLYWTRTFIVIIAQQNYFFCVTPTCKQSSIVVTFEL